MEQMLDSESAFTKHVLLAHKRLSGSHSCFTLLAALLAHTRPAVTAAVKNDCLKRLCDA